MKTLSLVQKVALAKAGGKVIDLGDESVNHVDFTVRIRGTMTQGKSFEKNVPASANMQQILALALSKLNMNTAESIATLVAEAAAYDADASKKLDDEFSKIKGYADNAMQAIKDATKTRCKGQLRAALEVTLVDNAPIATVPPMIEMKDVASENTSESANEEVEA